MRVWRSNIRELRETVGPQGNRIWEQYVNGQLDGYFMIDNGGIDNVTLSHFVQPGHPIINLNVMYHLSPNRIQSQNRLPGNITENGGWI